MLEILLTHSSRPRQMLKAKHYRGEKQRHKAIDFSTNQIKIITETPESDPRWRQSIVIGTRYSHKQSRGTWQPQQANTSINLPQQGV